MKSWNFSWLTDRISPIISSSRRCVEASMARRLSSVTSRTHTISFSTTSDSLTMGDQLSSSDLTRPSGRRASNSATSRCELNS